MIHQTPILGQEYDPSTEKTFADCMACINNNAGSCTVKHTMKDFA